MILWDILTHPALGNGVTKFLSLGVVSTVFEILKRFPESEIYDVGMAIIMLLLDHGMEVAHCGNLDWTMECYY